MDMMKGDTREQAKATTASAREISALTSRADRLEAHVGAGEAARRAADRQLARENWELRATIRETPRGDYSGGEEGT